MATYTGTNSEDNIYLATATFDRLYGGDANDFLAGTSGNDEVYGGQGNDLLFGLSHSALAAALLFCLSAGWANAQERIGSDSQPLTTDNETVNWTGMNNTVPVCWENSGFDREKAIVQKAVTNTWQWHANVTFTWLATCPTSGDAKFVRVRVGPQGTENNGAGGNARQGTGALSTADDNNPGVNLGFNPDGSADLNRVEYVGVHEFGHVLGFRHEQDAPGNEGAGVCSDSVDSSGNPVSINGYDRDSVMNYCNRDGNGTGLLTDVDIAGVQQVYGVRLRNVPNINSCASAPLSKRASLAAPWNNAGLATFAVYPSDGTKFLYWSQWAIQDGGWGDEVRWASGDFNGDGKTDVGAVWNLNGFNVLTVRLSTGSHFAAQHWLVGAGGWSPTTQWLSGDFNGDGKADMAGVWNNGGLVSIAVYLSDGTKFPGWTQWTDRDGGWGDEVKWVAGDFDGDGKTDIAAAWNNDGHTTLTVRRSLGDRFTHQHWLADAGHWWNASVFLAGDFNGDGRADIAQMWNDIGSNSIDVFRSNGTAFRAASHWSVRDGGWGPGVRWFPGDFDGDGRADIGAAWNNGGTNVLTVRSSTGSGFAQRHWLTEAGGWIDSTAWCSGSYQ